MTNRRRIVLTGAWGGGKTTLIEELLADPRYQHHLMTMPESAPLVRSMGFDPVDENYEKIVWTVQHVLEDSLDRPLFKGDRRSMLLHRGSLDTLAFWRRMGKDPQDYFRMTGASLEAELTRYDAVILLQSTAQGATKAYTRYLKEKERAPAEEAIQLEKYLDESWRQHPRFFSIPNAGLSWKAKSSLARAILDARIHTSTSTREEVNTRLERIRYPSSHQYLIDRRGRMRASPSAQKRLEELNKVLPRQKWESLIDVGCGKGMFLLWAIQQLGLKRATGIDAAGNMVVAGRETADLLNTPSTILHGTLNVLYPALPPSDLVFVFHCYHHLYFGSLFGTPDLPSHAYWFSLFNRITTDTLVFANPLNLPRDKISFYREKGFSNKIVNAYNEKAILDSANEHFHLQKFDLGGGRPYVIMRKRTQGAPNAG